MTQFTNPLVTRRSGKYRHKGLTSPRHVLFNGGSQTMGKSPFSTRAFKYMRGTSKVGK